MHMFVAAVSTMNPTEIGATNNGWDASVTVNGTAGSSFPGPPYVSVALFNCSTWLVTTPSWKRNMVREAHMIGTDGKRGHKLRTSGVKWYSCRGTTCTGLPEVSDVTSSEYVVLGDKFTNASVIPVSAFAVQ